MLFDGMTSVDVGTRVEYTVGDAWKEEEEDAAEQAAS